MQKLQVVVLVGILVMLCAIRVSIERLAVSVLDPVRVTEVRHSYNYDVQSYGTIKLNDRLVGLEIKR